MWNYTKVVKTQVEKQNYRLNFLTNNQIDYYFYFYDLRNQLQGDYSKGLYYGILHLGQNPNTTTVTFITPSGRFNTDTRIPLTFITDQDFEAHREEGVFFLIDKIIQLFVKENIIAESIHSTSEERKRLAEQSLQFNPEKIGFRDIFDDDVYARNLRGEYLFEGEYHLTNTFSNRTFKYPFVLAIAGVAVLAIAAGVLYKKIKKI